MACSALSLAACGAEETKKAEDKPAAPAAAAPAEKAPAPAAVTETAPALAAAAPAAEKPAEAAAPAKPAEPSAAAPAEKAAAPAADAPAAKPAEPAAAAAAAPAGGNPVGDLAKTIEGIAFTDGRYRNKDGNPVPVVTKDYTVDWATWQGFRRYHDACHVCHGPNALGSTFAPSLAESLKTMDYETFFGVVVGGRVRETSGTTYVMPAFGEDRNVMCYLDDIYTYVKARSINAATEGKQGLPAGRPNGREDISAEAKQKAADCTDAK